ncbi:hypothetical protein [Exiguobacterium sp. s140]|uniref:hypothetical protein n=1 Tax=Exiguobacterium sp. s140 TaxID=2751290 RepID=UPI001BE53E84|nr:hypothetical protein [Exiguobacterium sp. s140]
MISGYALISVNSEGKGKLYELDGEKVAFTYLNIQHGRAIEMEDEDIVEQLTPSNQKDVLLMVFFSYHGEGGTSGFEWDEYEDWLEVEAFQVLQENHEAHYLENLNVLVQSLENHWTGMTDELYVAERNRLIGEYEEFFGKKYEEPNVVGMTNPSVELELN